MGRGLGAPRVTRMALQEFHGAVSGWFRQRLGEPSDPQTLGWPLIREGRNVLIAAPTGTGKTLSAFLCAIDSLVQQGLQGGLEDRTQVLYISPLKALANDIRTNLLEPLEGIASLAAEMGLALPEIRPQVRSGDTTSSQRQKMIRRPPHILVTTPESLYILLTSKSGRRLLSDVRTVIVDEIHALARDKRGAHLQLSLERLEFVAGRPLQRIGLSATQKPIERMAGYLSGPDRSTAIVDVGHWRQLDLGVVVPGDELGAVASSSIWEETYDKLVELIGQHRTTLIFVNTRNLAEKVAFNLEARLGEDAVAAHHGSLSKEIRLDAEGRLKEGKLQAVVATASLELGIDIGDVDLVCQIGTTRSIALALQRVGRSGHWKGAVPKGRFFPLSRDQLVEMAALVHSIGQGLLDRIPIPQEPLDVLAQQIVAEASAQEWSEDELFETFRRADSFAQLQRSSFDELLVMLSEGTSTRRGRRGAYLHRDRVNGRIKGRRGAQLAAVTSGGAIPEVFDFTVKAEPEDIVVGSLDEDFASESAQGDIFLLGNTSWRIRRIESMTGIVRVADAQGAPPTVPFWFGEAPARTDEMSLSYAQLRSRLGDMRRPQALDWLGADCGLCPRGAEQAYEYVQAGKRALGAVPSQSCLVAERFFDEAGGMQLILHSPFGARINRAWGLALRKKFCRSFNFELQAAATEDAISIALSDQHSFPLDSVFAFLSSATAREVLIQAMLDSPLFATRWRWNAGRALQVLRFRGGRKVPPALQRIDSDDLLASVFPESAACLENIVGDIEIPHHPLVEETVRDCLTEAMDIDGLERLVAAIESGRLRCLAIDTPEPSPFSHEVLNANPYAFLDDAPLEERRARAVAVRRTLKGDQSEIGVLDQTAIDQVVAEARPPMRDADEIHDALLSHATAPEEELLDLSHMIEELSRQGRVLRIRIGERRLAAAAERAHLLRMVFPQAEFEPDLDLSTPQVQRFLWERDRRLDREAAIRELIRGRMESAGPTTIAELAQLYGLAPGEVEIGLAALEGQGQVLRGSFRSGVGQTEWCDRRLLARIHRLTLGRLRREIEPVSRADFMRFLFRWQHAAPGTRLHGEDGLAKVLEQLQGLEVPAAGWESAVLPARLGEYSPELLDGLCLSGRFAWCRLSAPGKRSESSGQASRRSAGASNGAVRESRAARPTRVAPVAFFLRERMYEFLAMRRLGAKAGEAPQLVLSSNAQRVREELERWGACFLEDLVRSAGLLPSQVEEGLWELAAAGLATADGFDNLRALIDPKRRRVPKKGWARGRSARPSASRMGRWAILRLPGAVEAPSKSTLPLHHPEIEALAQQLLQRWGIVVRELLARESIRPPWRDLLAVYRRMEARGELRGGRFISGLVGEQFALPEALDSLRALRRSKPQGEAVSLSAADPLNLTGIILPGQRVPPRPDQSIEFRDGALLEEGTSPLKNRLLKTVS